MVSVGLFVRMQAKPGKEADVENFLRGGSPLVQKSQLPWLGLEYVRAHLLLVFLMYSLTRREDRHTLRVKSVAALMERPDFFEQPPSIEKIDILADKLPTEEQQSWGTPTCSLNILEKLGSHQLTCNYMILEHHMVYGKDNEPSWKYEYCSLTSMIENVC